MLVEKEQEETDFVQTSWTQNKYKSIFVLWNSPLTGEKKKHHYSHIFRNSCSESNILNVIFLQPKGQRDSTGGTFLLQQPLCLLPRSQGKERSSRQWAAALGEDEPLLAGLLSYLLVPPFTHLSLRLPHCFQWLFMHCCHGGWGKIAHVSSYWQCFCP